MSTGEEDRGARGQREAGVAQVAVGIGKDSGQQAKVGAWQAAASAGASIVEDNYEVSDDQAEEAVGGRAVAGR